MTESPAGPPLPGATGSGRGEALTVAQLVAGRPAGAHAAATTHTPVAREAGARTPTTQIVSVGSLLRREGRAPHAVDRPMQPRAVRRSELVSAWPARPSSGRRRAAAVAGALVAAGSVLGAAIYNGAATHDSDAQAAADGMFPGLSLPSGADLPATLPVTYLPTTVALAGPLPATSVLQAGSTDWMRVAFPTGAAAPGSAANGMLNAAATMPAALGGAIPAADDAARNTPSAPPSSGGAGGTPGGGGAPRGVLPILNAPDRPTESNLLNPLTGGGGSSGDSGPGSGPRASTGPLQDVTEVARPVGETVGGVAAPVALAASPVGRVAGGVLAPVTEAAEPVTRSLSTVTRPVNDTLEPVTTPVLGALSPVTEPVLEAADPLTGPVLDAAGPVTGLLDTSAAAGEKTSGTATGGRHRAVADGGSATTPVSDLLGGTVSSVTGAVSPTDTAGGLVGGLTGGN